MIEKVNPSHPDKIADRIAGAIVDIAYAQETNPRIAVEVLIGHGRCHVIIETDTELSEDKIKAAIYRIAGKVEPDIQIVPQDRHLAVSALTCSSVNTSLASRQECLGSAILSLLPGICLLQVS